MGMPQRAVLIAQHRYSLGWFAVQAIAELLKRCQIASHALLKQLVGQLIDSLNALICWLSTLKCASDSGCPDFRLGGVLVTNWRWHLIQHR